MIGNWQKTENVINSNDLDNRAITHICAITQFYKRFGDAGTTQFENTRCSSVLLALYIYNISGIVNTFYQRKK